tara:strand:- start:2033 stop:2326 length:294 start_codon:yes stop_codon:yes gene_type:complete
MGKENCDACTRPVGGDNTRMVGQNWLCPPCEEDMYNHSDAGLIERMTKESDQKDALLHKTDANLRLMIVSLEKMSESLLESRETIRLMQQDIQRRQV